jgi:hypothetical protein
VAAPAERVFRRHGGPRDPDIFHPDHPTP